MSQDNSSDEVFHDAIEELPTTIRKMTKKNPTSSKKNVKTPKKNQITFTMKHFENLNYIHFIILLYFIL